MSAPTITLSSPETMKRLTLFLKRINAAKRLIRDIGIMYDAGYVTMAQATLVRDRATTAIEKLQAQARRDDLADRKARGVA